MVARVVVITMVLATPESPTKICGASEEGLGKKERNERPSSRRANHHNLTQATHATPQTHERPSNSTTTLSTLKNTLGLRSSQRALLQEQGAGETPRFAWDTRNLKQTEEGCRVNLECQHLLAPGCGFVAAPTHANRFHLSNNSVFGACNSGPKRE